MKAEAFETMTPYEARLFAYHTNRTLAGNLSINHAAQCAEVNGINIGLTRLEFKLLSYLIDRSNTAISRQELLKSIWQLPCHIETRATDDTIKRLRRKLKDNHATVEIETVRGFGFIVRNAL